MTIRSVDMQVLVQKIGEVAKIKQAEQAASNRSQQDFVNSISQDTLRYSKMVNQTLKGEKKIVNNNDEKDKRRRKGKEKEEKSEEKGSNIDIKI